MAVTNIQIMTWIGTRVANQRDTIINDLSSDGLSGLEHMTQDNIKQAYSSYANRKDSPFPIIITPIEKNIYSLVLWVQDMFRVSQSLVFPDGINGDRLIGLMSDSLVREGNQKCQKKIGKSNHNIDFNVKLKYQGNFDKC